MYQVKYPSPKNSLLDFVNNVTTTLTFHTVGEQNMEFTS